MSFGSQRPKKEDYVTSENLGKKSRQWLKEIEFYAKNRNRFRFRPGHSALLVIDMQGYFLDPKSHAYIPSSQAIINNVKELTASFREAGLPVVFTRHYLAADEDPGIMGRWWGDTIRESDSFSGIDPSLSLKKQDTVIKKVRYNAFTETRLGEVLEERKVDTVLITGVMTHLCCETTAREAFTRDYEVYFVIDATATQTEELHVSSLRTLSNGFAIPVTTKEMVTGIRGRKH